jgi:hypothetical protein
MSAPPPPDDRLVHYLLGRMSEGERAELEDRLLSDEELDQALLATTDELIQDYLAGDLTNDDHERFEVYFLASPDNRERLESMKQMLRAIERLPAGPRLWVRAVAAAAVVVLAVAGVVGVAALRRAQRDGRAAVRPVPAESPAPAETRLESPAPKVAEPASMPVVRLAANAGAPVRVRLPRSTAALRVEVSVDRESPSFDATVLAADGRAVWRAEARVAPRPGQPLILQVPARFLPSGRYTLRVEGEALREAPAPVFEYALRVVRER